MIEAIPQDAGDKLLAGEHEAVEGGVDALGVAVCRVAGREAHAPAGAAADGGGHADRGGGVGVGAGGGGKGLGGAGIVPLGGGSGEEELEAVEMGELFLLGRGQGTAQGARDAGLEGIV